MSVTFDVQKIREDFPTLKRTFGDKQLIFLDNGATTQKPNAVIDSMEQFYRHEYSSVKRGVYQLSEKTTQKFEKTRRVIQSYINAASEDEIVFTKGTTESINLVAMTWGRKNIRSGDEIIISALEHHANIVSWQILCEEKNAVLRVIPCDDTGTLLFEEYEKLLSERTKLVAITQAANSIGTVNDVTRYAELAHSKNALILVDAAQSIAHQKVDVQAANIDFLCFSGHKMYGPTGIGVLYGKYSILEDMPPYHGGGEMIEQVTFEKTTFAKPPARFEAGTPAIAEVIGFGIAVEYIESIGLEKIHAYEKELYDYAVEQMSGIEGLRIIGTAKEHSALVSFTLDGIHAHDAAMIFDEEAIAIRSGHHCAQPVMDRFGVTATMRASFSFYNTKKEIDSLVKAIQRVQKLFL